MTIPLGPLVKVVLYHPSLFKIEQDAPIVIYIQDIPHNHVFAVKPSLTDLGLALSMVLDFVKNWQELILVLLIWKSLHKICTVLQIQRQISSSVFWNKVQHFMIKILLFHIITFILVAIFVLLAG